MLHSASDESSWKNETNTQFAAAAAAVCDFLYVLCKQMDTFSNITRKEF